MGWLHNHHDRIKKYIEEGDFESASEEIKILLRMDRRPGSRINHILMYQKNYHERLEKALGVCQESKKTASIEIDDAERILGLMRPLAIKLVRDLERER